MRRVIRNLPFYDGCTYSEYKKQPCDSSKTLVTLAPSQNDNEWRHSFQRFNGLLSIKKLRKKSTKIKVNIWAENISLHGTYRTCIKFRFKTYCCVPNREDWLIENEISINIQLSYQLYITTCPHFFCFFLYAKEKAKFMLCVTSCVVLSRLIHLGKMIKRRNADKKLTK